MSGVARCQLAVVPALSTTTPAWHQENSWLAVCAAAVTYGILSPSRYALEPLVFQPIVEKRTRGVARSMARKDSTLDALAGRIEWNRFDSTRLGSKYLISHDHGTTEISVYSLTHCGYR
jgi:hypothetical protein